MAGNWRFFGHLHKALYRLSRGRFGHVVPDGRRILLLTTTGRRSGRTRTTPLVYMPLGDGFLVVASNAGGPSDPGWWHNLEANPEARVQAGAQVIDVRARRATPAEDREIWPEAGSYNDHWKGYRETCSRQIPLVILERSA